jgi:hypothetical protein
MMRHRAAAVTAGLLALGAALGCGPDPSTARGAVERFLDTHYVRIDIHGSLPLTSGVAHAKVEKEIALTRGVAIDETTRTPSIHYRLLEETPGDDGGVRFLYEATISPPEADSFQRRWLVLARQVDGAWMVTNYEELPE